MISLFFWFAARMRRTVPVLRFALGLALLVLTSACATGVTAPDAVLKSIPKEQKASIRLTKVDAEVAPGVAMTQFDLERVVAKVRAEIEAYRPGLFPPIGVAAPPGALRVKLLFTRFDEGSALIGLGQKHLDADVFLIDDRTGAEAGHYRIAKDSALGGIAGAVTSMGEVEKGFALSVADILKPKR